MPSAISSLLAAVRIPSFAGFQVDHPHFRRLLGNGTVFGQPLAGESAVQGARVVVVVPRWRHRVRAGHRPNVGARTHDFTFKRSIEDWWR